MSHNNFATYQSFLIKIIEHKNTSRPFSDLMLILTHNGMSLFKENPDGRCLERLGSWSQYDCPNKRSCAHE